MKTGDKNLKITKASDFEGVLELIFADDVEPVIPGLRK
jgi:hypothetical protein